MAQDIKTADIAIIGTGPAGISAAITAKIRNKEILLFGAEPVSSKVAKAHQILNYPGLPAVSGEELAQAYKRHLDELQIAVTKKRVHAVYAMGSYFAIQAGQEQYRADSVILACGMTADKPFPGENEFLGRGVSYCATCDAQFFKGKTLRVRERLCTHPKWRCTARAEPSRRNRRFCRREHNASQTAEFF